MISHSWSCSLEIHIPRVVFTCGCHGDRSGGSRRRWLCYLWQIFVPARTSLGNSMRVHWLLSLLTLSGLTTTSADFCRQTPSHWWWLTTICHAWTSGSDHTILLLMSGFVYRIKKIVLIDDDDEDDYVLRWTNKLSGSAMSITSPNADAQKTLINLHSEH